ncbi:polysaccharide biosynthesis tyrosine autokinase [Candidatus Avelusimicrobium faecicola]|uniref:polysaccharide biosynthesis tyrosine autokinase n=1 Tax=Candidatus Avelusimicrobium faecicola TaxID=3416205 RepID=UPI003C938982|nr:polysaccharide biosynthesis tyrosine autokinase [Spirochaetota bacterium]
MENTTNEELDLSYCINLVFKRFWLLVAMVALGLVAAVLVNLLMRPAYKATALMMINKEDAGKIDATPYGSFASEEDYYRTQYQLLQSRSLLSKVYTKMKLGQVEEFANPNGLKKLEKSLDVAPITRSRLVNVSATAYDPSLAADIVNTLTDTFVADNVSNRVFMGQDVIAALESTERSSAEQELLNSMPQVVNSDFIKTLKQQASKLAADRARLLAKYTTNHPDVISVQNQLDAVNGQINTETRRLVQSIKIELSGQFSGNNIRVIDPAVTPERPVRPRKLMNLAIGLLGGGLLGLMLVFVLEFLDQSVKSSEDLEEKLGLPFLGFVPYEKLKKKEREYATLLKDGNSLVAENVRNVRTMLDFSLAGEHNAPILITSSLQGEGKSHLSSNLLVALAQTGKKVLLVDGDLRRARVHRVFKLSTEKGLSNIWDADPQKADYAANIQAVKDVPNLFVMTSGQRPPNPAELLNTPKLADFIAWATQHYDQVVVDCPAIMPVSDTLLWGKYIPRAVFVIKYGQTNAKLAQLALDKLKKAGIKVLGAVIGHYRPEGLSYGKYGYYKNYSYYNEEK